MAADVQAVRTQLDPHLVTVLRPGSFEAEQYRRLRQYVERVRAERGVRVVAVTSAVASDGKTVTAVNLAIALAESPDARVLLIDADLRCPSVMRTLGGNAEQGGGLAAALESRATDIQKYVRETGLDNLSVLPSGRKPGASYELLASPHLSVLFHQLWQQYTFVIVDTPPLTAVADTTLLARVIDGYLVVVAAHSTPRKLLGEALNMLEPASVLGMVYNRDDQPLFSYYRNSYQRYFDAETASDQPSASMRSSS